MRGKFTKEVKKKLISKLENTRWTVWDYPGKWKEYPIPYRPQLVGKLRGEFKDLLDEMDRRGSRNPSCDICIYSKEPKGLVLVEIDDRDIVISNVIKIWFYVENDGKFVLELPNKEPLIFGPNQVRILHYVPEDATPYWEMLTRFLVENATRLRNRYKLINNLFTKEDAKKIATKKIEKIAEEIKSSVNGSHMEGMK